ncbi:MAG: ABC transporter ATP-binding protein [Saprospiraceae bacterium]|nr:ABC transporter ATP-binding protein [Saprospiraceae bacterium]
MKHFWYILKRLKPYRMWFNLSVFSNLMMSVFQIASIPLFIPFFELLFKPDKSKSLIFTLSDDPSLKDYLQFYLSKLINGKTPQEALFYVIIAFVITFLFKNIFVYLGNFFMTPVRNGFIKDYRKDIYDHLINLPVLYFKDKKKGDLLSRMSIDMQEIENSIITGFDALIKSPLIIIGAIVFMVVISPQLTTFVLILLPVTIFLIGGISRKLKQQSSTAQDYIGKLLILMEETIGSIKVIKSFNATSSFIRKFGEINYGYKKLLDKIMFRKAFASPLAEIMGVIVVAMLMWYSGTLVFKGEFLPSAFFAFIYAFFSIIEPAKSFSNAYYSFQKGAAALVRVEEIMNQNNNITDKKNAVSKTDFYDSIEFRNIWFRYPDSPDYVLQDINFKIFKGQKIALIGLSGAGKTTLADLISRFYDVQKGDILIDGVSIKDLKIDDLRNLIGIVSQDALLFNDSILRNICISDQKVNAEQLGFAVRTAMVDEFVPDVSRLDKIIIGDQGTKLSGGQKQRVAIARAIYKNAPVLILDEATSSLDSQSEKTVQKALQVVMENKTSIIIAHRLSTIQDADRVIVLENGKIIESGTPNELIMSKGVYYKFVQLQQL